MAQELGPESRLMEAISLRRLALSPAPSPDGLRRALALSPEPKALMEVGPESRLMEAISLRRLALSPAPSPDGGWP
jgi:hypothetical protein